MLRLLLLALASTWRVRVVIGRDVLEGPAVSRPVIFSLWHENIYPNGYHLLGFARRMGIRVSTLASLSRDGELATQMGIAHGVHVVRGSTSRGGLKGLRDLRRAMVEHDLSAITVPDGPRGPARVFQAGTVVLAATTGAPILPLAAAADRSWRLRSWDRLVIPKPFARVRIAVGEPWTIEEGESFPEQAEAVGRAMNDLQERCAALSE